MSQKKLNMPKNPMPDDRQRKIKELVASGLSYTKVGEIVGCNRHTVAYIINPVQREKGRLREARYERKYKNVRVLKLDKEEIPEGCFNVYDKWNWAI